MFKATRDFTLPTTITGSLPRPVWYTENLGSRPFRDAMADARYREQYTDAVGAYIRDQERAGLDIVTDGDARFDTDVGGMSWFQYPARRFKGLAGDCGFGREGMSRRIAFYKMVSIVRYANIVRRELGLPEAECRAADSRFALVEEV